jgi:hypothetical protein
MNPSPNHDIQNVFREFACIDHWRSPHAVTLTMKQGIRAPYEPAAATEYLDQQKASRNFRHFMNLLNRRVLGKRFQHHDERVSVIPVIEGGRTKRLHYHAAIDCPRPDLEGLFPLIIQSTWNRTKWAYGIIDIQSNADSGWINYISKTRDKPSYADAIDWENYHNPD